METSSTFSQRELEADRPVIETEKSLRLALLIPTAKVKKTLFVMHIAVAAISILALPAILNVTVLVIACYSHKTAMGC